MMREAFKTVGRVLYEDMANNPPVRFDVAARMGLTMAQVLEPGAFSARNINLPIGTPLFVVAVDGRFWAEITGTEAANGSPTDIRLVIEPLAQPVARPANPTRKAA